jgi:hypothetical protein
VYIAVGPCVKEHFIHAEAILDTEFFFFFFFYSQDAILTKAVFLKP